MTSTKRTTTSNNNSNPFLFGVAGASASGKTMICHKILEGLGDKKCVLVSIDWFYHGLAEGEDASEYNFDHPNAIDFEALRDTLSSMKLSLSVTVPKYDFSLHRRVAENAVELEAADVIIIEGIFALQDKDIRDLLNLKVYVDEENDICLVRRIRRDVEHRGRTLKGVLEQYERFVKPSVTKFILPSKQFADLVVPRGGKNLMAIDVLKKYIALK